MVDIVDPERGASGTLNFDFDTVTGQVCYSVESINIQGPYRPPIHVGTSEEKGGIVCRHGIPRQRRHRLCRHLPIDTNAILADKSGHYAELHDISEEWTIRGQLSEATTTDVVSLSVPMVDIVDPERGASGTLTSTSTPSPAKSVTAFESINIQGPTAPTSTSEPAKKKAASSSTWDPSTAATPAV